MASFKKSQITLFAIIALVILIALIVGFVIYNNLKSEKIREESKKSISANSQGKEIEAFINDCIRKVSFDGIRKLGQTGGYLDVPQLIDYKGTSFWQINQVNVQPFLNRTQEILIGYINETVPKCVEKGNITELGFVIEKDKPSTFIEFAKNDVAIRVVYPIKLTKGQFSMELSGFLNNFEIRYRSIFEAATEINERLFDSDFDTKNPLMKLDYLKNFDFDVDFKISDNDIILFTVTDKKSKTPTNELYTFNFAAKLGKSSLKRFIDLQNNSATNPTFLPYTVYSVDKKAQLYISEGTTVNLNGQNVKSISVQQNYSKEVTTKDVPVYKKNSEVIQKQDIKYVIDNPIYTFEPSGILFNKFEKLTLYYDNESLADKGVGILMGKNGFWVPISSTHEPEYKRVFSNILGFTEFTPVYCATQYVKRTIAEHFLKPSAGCFISLGLTIISLILTATVIISGLAVIGAAATEAGAAASYSISSIIANGVGAVATTAGLSVSTFSLIFVGISLASTATTIAGGVGAFYEKSPDNCQTFYPTCNQTITMQKQEIDGTGSCFPQNTQVKAGRPVTVCSQVKKCDALKKILCKPCSVKCTASFV